MKNYHDNLKDLPALVLRDSFTDAWQIRKNTNQHIHRTSTHPAPMGRVPFGSFIVPRPVFLQIPGRFYV